ncbi:hypothetical protein R3P38DRAFT_3275451 [Favolaschia claudopus]|uniref:Uncharacterized protein n=1 Tax=Favolaschia claudopus TaxID=2862362 RepID=A0AAW0ATK2_9AGAR
MEGSEEAFEVVSCTLVALPDAASLSGLESVSFPTLSVPAQAGTFNEDLNCIDLSALILSIFLHFYGSPEFSANIPHFLIHILSNPSAHLSMEVATTSVPIFDDRKRNPAYGYRSLGNFSHFYPTRVTQTHIHASAIDSNWPGLPEIPVYKASLRTLGIDPSRHFILILSHFGGIPIPHSSPFPAAQPEANSFPIQSGPDINAAAQDLYNFNDFNSVDPVDSGTWLENPLLIYPNQLPHTGIPSSSPIPLSSKPPSPSLPVNHCITSTQSLDTLLRMPQFVAGVSLSYVYRQAGITEGEERRAKHVKTCKEGLWGLVQNHRRLCAVLLRLGLAASDVYSRIEFSAGLKITTEDVLLNLQWTQDTFRRKTRLFSKARRIPKGVWKDTAPSDAELHSGWQNIVAMFGEGGFCDGTRAPQNHNLTNDAETNAATLTQTQLVWLVPRLIPLLNFPRSVSTE